MEFKTQNSVFEGMKAYIKTISTSLSDFTAGSVLQSLLFTVSNALGNLYETVRNVYNAIFIATATGEDLDLKVSDFGLVRKSDTTASGIATFSRSSAPLEAYSIPSGTQVKTAATSTTVGLVYETSVDTILQTSIATTYLYTVGTLEYTFEARFVDSVTTLVGVTVSGGNHTFVETQDYIIDKTTYPYRHMLRWTTTGDKPLANSEFLVTYIPISIDVPVTAQTSGKSGNTGIGTIVSFATSVVGFEEVYNYDRVAGGTAAETDDELRTRVPLYLSSLARATKNAIKVFSYTVPGVSKVTIKESTYPDGIVRVFIDDGSGTATPTMLQQVKDVLDGTINGVESDNAEAVRAAGIAVNVEAPQQLLVVFN